MAARQKAVWGLGFSALLLTPLALFALLSSGSQDLPPSRLAFPDLAIEQVAAIEITFPRFLRGVELVRLESAPEGGFIIPAQGGFPARADLVQALLAEMARLTLREPRTDNPQFHNALGLVAPEAVGQAVRVELLGAKGETLAHLLLGRAAPGIGQTSRFVRLEGQNQSWLAQTRLSVPQRVNDWLALDLSSYGVLSEAAAIEIVGEGQDARLVEGDAWAQTRPLLTPLFDTIAPAPADFTPLFEVEALAAEGEVFWIFDVGLHQGAVWARPTMPYPASKGSGAAGIDLFWRDWIFRLTPNAAEIFAQLGYQPSPSQESP